MVLILRLTIIVKTYYIEVFFHKEWTTLSISSKLWEKGLSHSSRVMCVTEMATGKGSEICHIARTERLGGNHFTGLATAVHSQVRVQAFLVPLAVPHGGVGSESHRGCHLVWAGSAFSSSHCSLWVIWFMWHNWLTATRRLQHIPGCFCETGSLKEEFSRGTCLAGLGSVYLWTIPVPRCDVSCGMYAKLDIICIQRKWNDFNERK